MNLNDWFSFFFLKQIFDSRARFWGGGGGIREEGFLKNRKISKMQALLNQNLPLKKIATVKNLLIFLRKWKLCIFDSQCLVQDFPKGGSVPLFFSFLFLHPPLRGGCWKEKWPAPFIFSNEITLWRSHGARKEKPSRCLFLHPLWKSHGARKEKSSDSYAPTQTFEVQRFPLQFL